MCRHAVTSSREHRYSPAHRLVRPSPEHPLNAARGGWLERWDPQGGWGGWGGRIRTFNLLIQSQLRYRCATPQFRTFAVYPRLRASKLRLLACRQAHLQRAERDHPILAQNATRAEGVAVTAGPGDNDAIALAHRPDESSLTYKRRYTRQNLSWVIRIGSKLALHIPALVALN